MDEWVIAFDGWDPGRVALHEALTTMGNGYLATRGAAPEATADGVHYPGTYLAGVFNRLTSEVSGHRVDNESLVNAPNWLVLSFRAEGGTWFGDQGTDVVEHHLELDLRRALLTRRARLRDREGHVVRLVQRRFVSMRDRHLAGLQTTIVAEGWSGCLEVRSALDGTVRNAGVARYRDLEDRHLTPIAASAHDDEVVYLTVESNQSHVRIAEAARTRLFRDGAPIGGPPSDLDTRVGYVAHHRRVEVTSDDEVVVEKVVALFTSRDEGISEPELEARDWAANVAGSFDELLARHVVEWHHLWNRMHIEIGTDGDVAGLVHLHELHILQTVSNNSVGSDVGVPARGLHGEAYRGHIFWDDLFVFPFLSLRFPQLTRALLLYRFRRLDQARRNAAAAGYAGAMFPWQSASNGRDETQTMHLNPRSGRWLPDASHLQRHVNAAVALNVWQYFQATGDLEFLRFYGAEMILEIARFWASTTTYNHGLDRYEIKGVMGPDEYHERYPDRDEPGLDNNAYTNLMAVWCLCRAFDVFEVLPPVSARELQERLTITQGELDTWGDISRKMRVCFHDGVISQFEGFEDLDELDWEHYRTTYGDIHRLDRILEEEGDSTNRYQLLKQPDVMMLFYLLSAEELTDLLVRLGYAYDGGLIGRSVEYYVPRTAHGSTLSRVVQAWVLARQDREQSWKIFLEALHSDVDDVQGGTTGEGIHLGAMGGTLDLLQRCYSGLETREDVLRINPAIPPELGLLAFDIRYRGHLVVLELTPELARVRVDLAEGAPIDVEYRRTIHQVQPGNTVEISLL